MTAKDDQFKISLDDIYDRITRPLLWYCFALGGMGALWFLPIDVSGLKDFLFFFALFLVGLLGLRHQKNIFFIRHLLTWSSTLLFMAALWLYPHDWLPSLLVPVILISAILVPGSQWIISGLILAEIAGLVFLMQRGLDLYILGGTLAFALVVSRYTAQALFIALEWVISYANRTGELLEEARQHRAELAQTLKSLEIVYNIQQRMESELIFAKKQAEEAGQAKQQFAANISHELRTPLSIILGFSEIMHLSPEVYGSMEWSPSLRRDVYQIYASSQYLQKMIDDILVLSKFDLAEFVINPEPTPMPQFLRDTTEIIKNLFLHSTSVFTADIPDELPTLVIDRTRIRQVVFNLISNAKRFTEFDRSGKVELRAYQTDQSVCIQVHDDGPGITPQKIPLIFDPFYQDVNVLRKENKGAGLGLAISKRFVEAHGGTIGVESVVGEGSIFHFSLPTHHSSFGDLSKPWYDLISEKPKVERPCLLLTGVDPDLYALLQRKFPNYEVVSVDDDSVSAIEERINFYHPCAIIQNTPPGENKSRDFKLADPIPVIECSFPSMKWIVQSPQVVGYLFKPIALDSLIQEIQKRGPLEDIMIIDDEWGFVQLVTRALEKSRLPLNIHFALDGQHGLEMIREKRPHLLLLDINMPGMSGLDVLREMRREEALSEIPVIIITVDRISEIQQGMPDVKFVVRRSSGLTVQESLACAQAVLDVMGVN